MSVDAMNTLRRDRESERDLVIIGSGGFARETAQAVRALNASNARWRLLGYLDDAPERHGLVIEGTVVLGGRDQVDNLPNASFVVCTGRPDNYVSRLRIVAELGLPRDRYATIVHPSSSISTSSSIGPGSVLLAHVTLTSAVTIGAHVAVMPQVTLTHDNVVDDFATIASAASLGGGARIRRAAYLGAGCLIGENRIVGACSLVGMGAVVTCDVPAYEVWVGVPARRLREANISGICVEEIN